MKVTMNKNKVTLAIFSILFAGTMLHSQEAFSQSHKMLSSAEAGQGVLTQIGSPTGVMQPLKGFAKDLPLTTVLRQITPNGWLVKKNENDNLDVSMLVSWQGGSNWIETLGSIVQSYPVNANVNWNTKEITVMAVENKGVSKQMIFELEQKPATVGVTSGASQQTTEVAAVPAAPASSWSLSNQISLKENVLAWGKQAGYRIIWLGEDYSVDEERVLSGAFDQETGPIKQLATDYGPKSRVQQPLSFQFFQNSTLVVENWKFEQSGFPQYGSKE